MELLYLRYRNHTTNVILQAAYKELEQFNGEPQQPALHDKVSLITFQNKCRQWNPDLDIFTDPDLNPDRGLVS
jgi:hypothetical protein